MKMNKLLFPVALVVVSIANSVLTDKQRKLEIEAAVNKALSEREA